MHPQRPGLLIGEAAVIVMPRFFGTAQLSFTMTSGPTFAGITRSFKGFGDAQEENGASRGRQAFPEYLQPYRP
jgi:hypothetical protein